MFWEKVYDATCNLAFWLFMKLNIKWLFRRVDFTIMSPKDQKIYRDLIEKYKMTDFEWKIIQNSAYRESFIPNETNVLGRPTESSAAREHDEKVESVNYNIDDSLWSIEELINLSHYRNQEQKRNRILEMAEYYSKHYVLMILGLEAYE